MRKYLPYLLGILLAAFALLTLYLSGSILFDLFDMRTKQGDFVWVVIWGNFIAALLYLIAVYGFFTQRKIAYKALAIALVVIVLAGVGLFFHIHSGGSYMTKTPKALVFRFVVTGLFFWGAKKLFSNKASFKNTY